MRLKQSSIVLPIDPLMIKGQQINIADYFKYIESYNAPTDSNVKIRIGLAAFAKIKSILS